ncbi:hypothetical protein [Methylobacterium sp. Leaf118]|uniref:hypothetical protein n=1 Tax=Methylobacterium sp. Leaf118 TaxID=2876562 RepID=UPI001E5BF11A|nr:hypothetical protein [Methylobacterium sp. Leaf118]
MGPGAQGRGGGKGKRDGSGAMTERPEGVLGENQVLSNRDKSQPTNERGLDRRNIQIEQDHDHAGARQSGGRTGTEDADASGPAGPMTNPSGVGGKQDG